MPDNASSNTIPVSQTPEIVTSPPSSVNSVSETPQPKKSALSSKVLMLGILLLLLVITGAYFFANSQKQVEAPVRTDEAVVQGPLSLNLESPGDGDLIENNMLVIRGTTSPNTTVAYLSETAEGTVQSSVSGVFEGTLALEEGINTVTITAYGANGEEKTKTIDVVYDGDGGSQE